MLSLFLAEILAITGARLVPADPQAELRVVTVLIDGERITQVGENLAVPEDARKIDGQGLFLCAAPIDGFAYWDQGHDLLYASAGISLVTDHGNNVLAILAAKASSERAGLPALRIAGPVIDGFPPSTNEASVARTPLEAETQITPMIEEGIDFVAFQSNLAKDPWRKLIEVAHKHERQVWGPLPHGVSLAEALEAGQDGYLFLDVLLQPGQAWSSVQASDLDAPIAALIKARARMVPFLNGNARLLGERSTNAPELELLSPQFANYWRGELASLRTAIADPEKKKLFQETGAKVLELQRGLLLRLHAGGVPLIPGSGAPHPWLFPGGGLHDELGLWQGAGIPAREVLRLATLGAAQALGIEKDRGSIEAGKFADFVLLRDDPSKDIAALRKPEWVVLRGSANSRATLDAAVAALRERQLKAQLQAETPIEVGSPPKVEGELVLAGYCETSALGVRTAAERYTAVRSADGKLSFCGRRVVPQAEGAPVQIESLMRVAEGKLEYFLIKLKSPKHELSVEGFLTAAMNQTRVERKADGVHIDLQTSPEAISVVDVGSVTTMLVIEATKDSGTFPVMTFHEGLQMEVVRWELSLGADGAHYLRTPEGPKVAVFDERGALKGVREQRGSGTDETMGTNTLAKERAGLPFSASKLKEIERARARLEEARKDAPPATEPPKSGGLK